MPKMGVNPEQTKAPKPIPGNQWYKLKVVKLTCKKSPKGHNYLALLKTEQGKPETNDHTVFFQMNNGFMQAKQANDFTHGVGLVLEQDGSFPGDWKLKDAAKPDDFDGAEYSGPILGRLLEAELVVDSYNGEERNVVKQIRCRVADCVQKFPDIKHLTDLQGKKK